MAVKFDEADIVRIQQSTDIVELISEYIALAKKGREMVGLCPFHDDHKPSFNVSSSKQIFKCFACSAGGDVFKFLQMKENLTFPQAVERLAQRAGIKLEQGRFAKPRTGGEAEVDPNKLAKVNEFTAKYFQHNLNDAEKGRQVREYLAERKISDESIKKWRIGLAVSGDDLVRTATAKKIPSKFMLQAGLVTGNGRDRFVNRLMIPITDTAGRVIGFGGRTLTGEGAKYINSPATVLFDKSNTLYGIDHARDSIVKADEAVVVEGYTDCIILHQFGFTNVVATLGTSFTNGHGRFLKRYAKRIVLVYDNDVAGVEAANRAMDVCLAQHIDIKIASIPQEKDPCDFLLSFGGEEFRVILDGAVDVLEFKWDRMTAALDSNETMIGRKVAITEFLQSIATAIKTGKLGHIERGLMVNKLSNIIALDSKTINAELNRMLKHTRTNSSAGSRGSDAAVDLGQGLSAVAQREILEVLLNKSQLFDGIRGKITVDNFDVPILRQIAVILFELLNTRTDVSVEQILAKTESVEIGNCIVSLAESGERIAKFQSRLDGAINALEQAQKERIRNGDRQIKDPADFLRNVAENTQKRNPYNVGMV